MASSVKLSKVPDSSPGPKIVSGACGNSSASGEPSSSASAVASDQELARRLGAGQGVDGAEVEAVGQGDGAVGHAAAGGQGRGRRAAIIASTRRGIGGRRMGRSATLRSGHDTRAAVS